MNLAELKMEKFFSYFIISIFLLGLVTAAITDTWYAGLAIGGFVFLIWVLLQVKFLQTKLNKYVAASLLVIMGAQLTYQLKYIPESFFIFTFIILFVVVLKEWKLILFASILVLVHQLLGNVFLKEYGFKNPHVLFYLFSLIAVFLAGLFAVVMKRFEINKKALQEALQNEIIHKEKNLSFATEISSGNFDASFEVSDDNVLGHSLVKMSQNLKKAAIEEKNRTWAVEGIAQIGEILRQNHENIEDLANKVVAHLVKYVNATQGGIFVFNNENPKEPFLELKGCYAYNKRKFLEKRVEIGQGLLGQACKEKAPVYLTEVPQDYISITSGLGEANPDCIMIVPLKIEDEIVGAIELASFEKIKPHEREFLEKVSESIASSVINSKVNERTSWLLQESQTLTEQLRAQEEEVRQNMEELQATQEDLQRKNEEQKKMQDELSYEKFLFYSLMNNIPDRIHFKDEKGRFLRVNKAKAMRHGLEASEIIGKTDFDFFDKESASRAYNEEEEIMKTGIPVIKKEVKLSFNDNQDSWALVTKMPLHDGNGKVIGTFGITTDITERKKIEVELQKETYLMNALLANTTDNIYFKDKESKFIRVSVNMAKAFGVNSPEELIGKSDFDFFTKDHAMPAYTGEQEIMKTGTPIIDLVEKETWEDGRETYVSTSKMPLVDQNGSTVGTFGVSRDVTKEKKAQEMVARNEKRYKWMMENSKDIGFILTKELEVEFLSPSLNKNLGYQQEEVLGNYFLDIVHEDDHSTLHKVFLENKMKDDVVMASCRLKNNKDEWKKIKLYILPLKEEGVHKGFVINSYLSEK